MHQDRLGARNVREVVDLFFVLRAAPFRAQTIHRAPEHLARV